MRITGSQNHSSWNEQSLFQSPTQNRVSCSGTSGFHPVRFWSSLHGGGEYKICSTSWLLSWWKKHFLTSSQACFFNPSLLSLTLQSSPTVKLNTLLAEPPSQPPPSPLPDAEGCCKVLLNLSLPQAEPALVPQPLLRWSCVLHPQTSWQTLI